MNQYVVVDLEMCKVPYSNRKKEFHSSHAVFGYTTHIYDGNFYTGFQSWRQAEEFKTYCFDDLKELPVGLNEKVCKVLNMDSFILTSGHERVWNFISDYLGVLYFAGVEMSAETKFFITKKLQEAGKTVIAYGKKVYVSKKDSIIEDYLYKEKSLDFSAIKIEELDPGLLFVAMNVGLKLSDSDFVDFAKKVMPIFIKELSEDNRDSIMNTYYQRLDFKKLFERELGEDNGSYQEAINLLFDNVDYQMFSNDTIKAYISIFEHVGALYFDSYENDGKRIQLRKCLEYAESFIDRIQVPFVKNGLERILIFDYERFGSNWNKCTTHYSYNDKTFLCRLWGKYHKGHEKDVVMSMYQMKFDELLPEVLPVLAEVVEALSETGEVSDKNCVLILKSIVLKVLLKFSDVVKADQDYHDAYERILNALIKCNDESAAVILDEYRTH